MNDQAVDVVATTISGSIKDWGKVKRIVPLFNELGFDNVTLHAVDSHAEARRITCSLVERGRRIIISAGGSGTFNSVLEGCIDAGRGLGGLRLGFLRKGSADLIGKALEMPDDIETAVKVFAESIRSGRTVPCDVIKAGTSGPGEGVRHFLGYGGTGIFGRIPHYTENRFIKYYKGVLSQLFGDMGPFFVGATLSTLELSLRKLGGNRPRWRIRIDGDDLPGGRYQAMIIVNGYLGPDLPFAGDAPLGSGRFHMFALRDLGVLRLPGQFRRAWDASILRQQEEYGFEPYAIDDELVLATAAGSPFPCNIDGSTMMCSGEARFRIVDSIHLMAK